ncbi:aminopeptidase P N-terminal domain-containing protein, partial [Bordetella petrii]|uniref:aminopeptidase P N-terminal domain-containing protein n=1 Tax=Bordetella petrii TaxID=94624 RepID=UPI001E4F4BBB
MSLPAADFAPFAARRRRLLERMRAAGGGIAVLSTAPQAVRNRDTDYPYRHDSDFYYLTGFTEPDAWLVLVAGALDRAILFCRARHPEQEIWEGYRAGPEAAKEHYGFDEAHTVDALDEMIPSLLLDQPALYRAYAATGPIERRLRRWHAAAEQQGRGR